MIVGISVDYGDEGPTPLAKQMAREQVVLHAEDLDQEFELLAMLDLM